MSFGGRSSTRSSSNRIPLKRRLFPCKLRRSCLDSKSKAKTQAVSNEFHFLDIEIPFDWDGDEGLEPNIDGSMYSYLDPSNAHVVDLSNAFIPLPGFSKYSSRHHHQEHDKGHGGHFGSLKYFFNSMLLLLVSSIILLGPSVLLNYVDNELVAENTFVLFYKRNYFFALFLEFSIFLYFVLWEFIDYSVDLAYSTTHEHVFDVKKLKTPDSNRVSFNYSFVLTIISPETFEIIMMSKNSIFFCIFFFILTFTYKFYFLYIYSAHLWAETAFAIILNRALNLFVVASSIAVVQKIFFSKIVSDFYRTVYSERLMDLCFAIQAIHRLITHVEDSAQSNISFHNDCHHLEKKALRAHLKRKKFRLFNCCNDASLKKLNEEEEAQEESIEPIISSYHQFRQLLLNSTQFEGIIDSKATAKNTAKKIYEHFYIPSAEKLAAFDKLSGDKRPFASLLDTQYAVPIDAEIKRSDFSSIFNPADEEKLFHILNLSQYGAISPLEFKIAFVKLFLEKEALAKGLLDHARAVKKLDHLCSLVALCIIIVLTPLIVGLPVKELFITIGGLWSLSFIFGQSSAVLFNSIIFMFITHPFDVGDRVYVFSETYFVHEIGIYYTVLQTVDGLLVYVPNSLLIDQHIVNIKRSKNMVEWIDIIIDFNTPTSKIAALATKVRQIIEMEGKELEVDDYQLDLTRQGSSHSHSSLIKCVEVVGCRNFRLGIALTHKYNFQDGFKRIHRHVKFMKQLQDAMKELSIVYYPPKLRLRYQPEQFS